MREICVTSEDELLSVFAEYEEGHVFRGQTGHYLVDGTVSIPTSFKRHGCVPPLMLKWTHYAKAIIRAVSGASYFDINIELSQAILQHYGWRSFFVDVTKEPAVACWFAANQCLNNRRIHMSENWEEDPVWLRHLEADFEPSGQPGHIYVIALDVVAKLGIGIHDLTALQGDEGMNVRFQAQKACLIGTLRDRLPPETIVAHIVVPSEILERICAARKIKGGSDVFPTREEDFILRILLSLPWVRMPLEFAMPAYARSLELPEYDAQYRKRLDPSTPLYEEYWICEASDELGDAHFRKFPTYKMSEVAYYSNASEPCELSAINAVLAEHDGLLIELDNLVLIPENHLSGEFEKGILVEKIDESTIVIGGLIIEYFGHRVRGAGINKGWVYDASNAAWERVDHEEACPCNNDLRHQLQFSLLGYLNYALTNGEFHHEHDLTFKHQDITR